MIKRIKEIIEKSGLSNGEFSDRIGIQKSSLSHVLSERNKPSLDFIMKILEAFPQIDSDWLLFGRNSNDNKADIPLISNHEKTTENPVDIDTSKEIHSKSTSKSEIDKIVIFYTNGSFEVFSEKA